MAEIRITERALQKYNETSNGSKDQLNDFIKNINKNNVNKHKLRKLKISNSHSFYYRKCKNVYAIVVIKEDIWFLVDILIKKELYDLNN